MLIELQPGNPRSAVETDNISHISEEDSFPHYKPTAIGKWLWVHFKTDAQGERYCMWVHPEHRDVAKQLLQSHGITV